MSKLDERSDRLKAAAEKYVRTNGEEYFRFLAAALKYAAERLRDSHDVTESDREAATKLDRIAFRLQD